MKLFRRLTLTLVIAATATALFAEGSNINFKIGAQWPDAPDKTGLDTAISFNYGADKYFTIGAEAGFGWVKYKEEGDSFETDNNVTLTEVEKTNIYSFPLMAVATVRLADMQEQYGFMPYITGGAGYSWAVYKNSDIEDIYPEFDNSFDGFTWQVVGGCAILLGSDSNMTLTIEAGWRGAELENEDSIELDMSGIIARAGVTFPLEPAY